MFPRSGRTSSSLGSDGAPSASNGGRGGSAPTSPSSSWPRNKSRASSSSIGFGDGVSINVSQTKYDTVKNAASEEGYALVDDREPNWDLCWSDLSVSEARVAKLMPFQRINHFPGMLEICRKSPLSRHLKRMQNKFARDYAFAPPTWEHPRELSDFKRHVRANPGSTYIVKPTAGSSGRGIYLIANETQIGKDETGVVIQRYVDNPLLLDGHKFDMRVYALVTCVNPLAVYVHEEGLVRLATTKYEKPTKFNMDHDTMHLTNYALNKHSNAFVDSEYDDEGTKRTLSATFDDFMLRGCDVRALRREIEALVVKTILPIQPHLAHTYHCAVSAKGAGGADDECEPASRCFEVLGFDVMLDERYKPWLIEVNHSPSFTADSDLDLRVKSKLLSDVIGSLRPDPSARKRFLGRERGKTQSRLYAHTASSTPEFASYSTRGGDSFAGGASGSSEELDRRNGDGGGGGGGGGGAMTYTQLAAQASAKTRTSSPRDEGTFASSRFFRDSILNSPRKVVDDDDDAAATATATARVHSDGVSGEYTGRRMNLFDPPARLGGFKRAHPPEGYATAWEFAQIVEAAGEGFAPRPGCVCVSCKGRTSSARSSYTAAKATRGQRAMSGVDGGDGARDGGGVVASGSGRSAAAAAAMGGRDPTVTAHVTRPHRGSASPSRPAWESVPGGSRNRYV